MSWFPVLLSSGEPPSGAPSSSGSSGRRRGRRWWRAGWGALAVVVACGAVACSGGGGSASSVSVPPYTPGEASASSGPSAAGPSASAAASGAPTVPGEVTAESLSDPDSDHFVAAIPEDLDQTQREVVVAYVAYDRATWRAYRAMDGDHSAVEAAAGGDALKDFQDDYAAWAAQGLHASGVYRVTIEGIHSGGALPDEASVVTCVDQHDVDLVKADGTSSGDDLQHNYSYMVTLSRSSGSWMVMSDERVGVDQC